MYIVCIFLQTQKPERMDLGFRGTETSIQNLMSFWLLFKTDVFILPEYKSVLLLHSLTRFHQPSSCSLQLSCVFIVVEFCRFCREASVFLSNVFNSVINTNHLFDVCFLLPKSVYVPHALAFKRSYAAKVVSHTSHNNPVHLSVVLPPDHRSLTTPHPSPTTACDGATAVPLAQTFLDALSAQT